MGGVCSNVFRQGRCGTALFTDILDNRISHGRCRVAIRLRVVAESLGFCIAWLLGELGEV